MSEPKIRIARRARVCVVCLALAATAAWLVSALIDNRQRAWAQEAAELQALPIQAHFAPTAGEIFGGLLR